MLLTRGGCLQGLLGTQGLTDVPFLILANKIDVPQAASEEEVRGALGLHNMTTGKGRCRSRTACGRSRSSAAAWSSGWATRRDSSGSHSTSAEIFAGQYIN